VYPVDSFAFIFVPKQRCNGKPATSALRALTTQILTIAAWNVFSQSRQRLAKIVMLTTHFASKSSLFKKALKDLRRGDAIEAHDLEAISLWIL